MERGKGKEENEKGEGEMTRCSCYRRENGVRSARKTEILVLSLLDARRGVGPFPSISPINWARSPIIKYQQVSCRYRRKAHSNKVSEYQE